MVNSLLRMMCLRRFSSAPEQAYQVVSWVINMHTQYCWNNDRIIKFILLSTDRKMHEYPVTRFNINMQTYQYRESHYRDKTVVRSSYLHNGDFYSDIYIHIESAPASKAESISQNT